MHTVHVRDPFKGRDAQADDIKSPQTRDTFLDAVVNGLIQANVDTVMTPAQIEQLSLRLKQAVKYTPDYVSMYLIAHVMRSYEHGNHNKFILHGSAMHIYGYQLYTLDTPLRLEIRGSLGHHSFDGAYDIVLNVLGHASDEFARSAQESRFVIEEAGDDCGVLAVGCHFHVRGKVGAQLATSAQDCEFRLDGPIGANPGIHAHDCKFYIKKAHYKPKQWRKLGDNKLIVEDA